MRRARLRAHARGRGTLMSMRPRNALAVGLMAAGLLTLGTLGQAAAFERADGDGTRHLSGCGTLDAHGAGTAHLHVDGDPTVTVTGQVIVNEDSGDVSVDRSGDWSRSSLAGDDVRYDGHGTLHIHGTGIVADVSGGDATL